METPPSLPNRNAKLVRPLGWLLIVLGLFLSGGIAIIAGFLHNTIVHNHDPGSHSHWQGSPEFTRTTFELFGAVFLFGVASVLAGIFQAATGRRNFVLVGLMLLALAAICYFGCAILSTHVPS